MGLSKIPSKYLPSNSNDLLRKDGFISCSIKDCPKKFNPSNNFDFINHIKEDHQKLIVPQTDAKQKNLTNVAPKQINNLQKAATKTKLTDHVSILEMAKEQGKKGANTKGSAQQTKSSKSVLKSASSVKNTNNMSPVKTLN